MLGILLFMSSLYDNPKYYEIAFSFRDISAEVDVFEECFKRFSKIPVKSVLELGCGNSPHMEELIKRGYQYSGIDISKTMLEYSRQKASYTNADANLAYGNMVDFFLASPVDFVYTLLGSLYVKNALELKKHFKSVAKTLKNGGLYLLDWCVQFNPLSDKVESWEICENGIRVKATVQHKVVNPVEQTFNEIITLKVNDHGAQHTIVDKSLKRAIYSQEFLCLVKSFKNFEFIGWWDNWNLDRPLEKAIKINRPITLLRRA